jgi:hypothetical protein
MITTIDKALVAVIMGVLFLLNSWLGISIGAGVDEVTVAKWAAIITPVLVWLIPNRTA